MAYGEHNGVLFSEWKTNDGGEIDKEEPDYEDDNATVEEIYYSEYSGNLMITVYTDDKFISIDVPVIADSDWNEFVDSLPRWE